MQKIRKVAGPKTDLPEHCPKGYLQTGKTTIIPPALGMSDPYRALIDLALQEYADQ
jgi:hypothetical protein